MFSVSTLHKMLTTALRTIELSIGLIVSSLAPVSKIVRKISLKHFPSVLEEHGQSNQPHAWMYLHARKPKRRHEPGGLSELDSMKTPEATIDHNKPLDFITNVTLDIMDRANSSSAVV